MQRALGKVFCHQAGIVRLQAGGHLHGHLPSAPGSSSRAARRGEHGDQEGVLPRGAPVGAQLLELGEARQLDTVKLAEQLVVGSPRAEDALQLLVPAGGARGGKRAGCVGGQKSEGLPAQAPGGSSSA